MIFLLGCLLFVLISTLAFWKIGVNHPFSKGFALAIGLSMLIFICLSLNYSHSLIPGVHDGIGISNQIAYWVIGEDQWSIEKFKNVADQFMYLTLILLIAYPFVLGLEARVLKK